VHPQRGLAAARLGEPAVPHVPPLIGRGLPTGPVISGLVLVAQDRDDVLSGHAVEVKMKAAGWFTLGHGG